MAKDLYKYFRVEAGELLDQLGKWTLDLEKGTGTSDVVSRLLRLSHTLKGAARVVKQREIADQAHAIEEVLVPYRESADAVPRECIDTLLEQLDNIGRHVSALVPAADVETPAPGKSQPEDGLRTVHADIAEMDALLDGVAETHTQMLALRSDLGSIERVRHLVNSLAGQLAERRGRESGQAVDGIAGNKARSMIEELRAILDGLGRGAASSLDMMDRELRQVRDAAEQLRLIPADTLFVSLERIARDAAQALGKRVVFQGRGGDVRLDAQVLGAVQGALLQVVRNAVAHGIEPESGRKAAGKPVEGRVTLDVERRGRKIAFSCRDDGSGVNVEAVRRAAQRRGLPSADIQKLGAEELLDLLLRGGISTAGTVTEVSGRGIGLDVVRETSERLGGKTIVRTDAGKGTTVEIVVPLSLASLEALVVEASGVTATIPLDAVRRTLRVAPQDVSRTAHGESVLYDGKVVPFISLSRALQGVAVASRDRRPWSAVIVATRAGALAAIGADRLLGTANVVLRPLPDLSPAVAIVTGASLDAAGNAQLVLDPDGLVAQAQRADASTVTQENRRLPVLVVDDSLTTRMLEQSILESAGFDVDLAISGEEALEKTRHKSHVLFLVDVEMPGMDGFTFIERVRADPALRDIPAILITSRSTPEDRQRGQDVGAQGYIVKSEFDQREFLQHVRRLVG